MRWFILAMTFALLLGASATGLSPDDEGCSIQGKWNVAHRYFTPSEATDPIGKLLTDLGGEVEIKDGKLQACDPEKLGFHFLITLHSSSNPKGIDLQLPEEGGQTLLAIYSVDEGVLTIDVATGSNRPTEFRQDGQVMLVLKRPTNDNECGGN